jgi:ATP-dependent Clp protease protease subunit
MKKRINEILSRHTGKDFEQLSKDTDRDFYMSSADAKEYGLIDNILVKKEPLKKTKAE